MSNILSDLSRIKLFLKSNPTRVEIVDYLLLNGWNEIGIGLYKIVFAKGRLVAKIQLRARDNEIALERRQSRLAKKKKLDHLIAKIYYADRKIIIQQRITPCKKLMKCSRVKTLVNTLIESGCHHIQDYQQNHGHNKQGKIVFFDYVGIE